MKRTDSKIKRRNPVVRHGTVLRKGGPHVKTASARRAQEKASWRKQAGL